MPGRGHLALGRFHRRLEGRLDPRTVEPEVRRAAPRRSDFQPVGATLRTAMRPLEAPVFADGFAAIEAEFVVPALQGCARECHRLDHRDSAAFRQSRCTSASKSPAARWSNINDFGPAVVASDFGNNAGLLLGAGDRRLADAQPRIAELRDSHRRRGGRTWQRGRRQRRSACRPRLRPAVQCASRTTAARRATSCRPAPQPVSTRSRQDNRPRQFSPASAA